MNLLVASYLARLLRAAGADIVLTRESDETLSALRRVELAEKAGAQWFISIGHGSQNAGPALVTDQLYIDQPAEDVCVMHYASSERGGRLADAIATALKEEGVAESVYVGTSSAMVVTHTSGVAVIVLGPDPSACETEGTLRHPEAARKEADAIYRGILASFSSTERESENVTTMEEDR